MAAGGGEHSRAEARGASRWLWLGLAVAAGAMLLRLWLAREPINSDDVQYFADAAESCHEIRSQNSLRLVYLALPTLLIDILGRSLTSFYATVYGYALLSTLSLFVFAWAWAGPRAAVLATLIRAVALTAVETDTRLAVDGVGASFWLLALTALGRAGGLAAYDWRGEPARDTRHPLSWALLAGVLFWAAVGTRASFAAHGLAGLCVALLSQHRWTLVAGIALGSFAGLCVELLVFQACYGNAFARIELLLGYGAKVAGHDVFQGYSLRRIVTRYPELLRRESPGELLLFALGTAGALRWGATAPRRPALAKLAALAVPFSVMAFAVVQLDPPVPLMREKLRYYASCAPLFFVAAAELVLWSLERLRTLASTPLGRATLPAALALAFAAVLAVALGDSLALPGTIRRGHAPLLAVGRALEAEARASGTPRRLQTDWRTARVMALVTPARDGWALEPIAAPEQSAGEGFVLLHWPRLLRNVRYGHEDAEVTSSYQRFVERLPVLLREGRHPPYTEIHRAVRGGIERTRRALPELAGPWSVAPAPDRGPASDLELPIRLPMGARAASGGDPAAGRPGGGRLPGGHFLEVVVDASAPGFASLDLSLYAWREVDGGSTRQTVHPMGRVHVGASREAPRGEFAAWTYVPEDVSASRIVLEARRAPVTIHAAHVLLLGRHPLDRVLRSSGEW